MEEGACQLPRLVYNILTRTEENSLEADVTKPDLLRMKRVIDERVTEIPHNIFADDGSDTDSATSNIDEDKREQLPSTPPPSSHDDDHDYFFTETPGFSALLVGRIHNANSIKENQALPSISKNKACAPIPENASQVEPSKNPSSEEMTGLLDLVALEVNRSITGPLFAKRSGPGVSVLWISNSRPTSVIGEICVLSSGVVEVYAKGYQLSSNHALWTKIGAPVSLVNGEVQRFVKHVNHAVNVTREYIICAGVTEQKQLWDTLSNCFVERNQFREPDICRSESCDLLVAPQRIRCSECKSLCMRLRSKKKKKNADK